MTPHGCPSHPVREWYPEKTSLRTYSSSISEAMLLIVLDIRVRRRRRRT